MNEAGSHLHRVMAIAMLGAFPLLSGCVVAAIPVLAAGAMAGKQVLGDESDAPDRSLRVAIPPAPVAPTTSAPAQAMVAKSAEPVPPPVSAIVRTRAFDDGSRIEVSVPRRSAELGSGTVVSPSASAPLRVAAVTEAAPAPAPVESPTPKLAAAASPPASPMRASPAPAIAPVATVLPSGGYAAFARYAGVVGNVPVIGSERRSAMLANPAALTATTRTCAIQPAAVMIDLDPAGSTFDPTRATRADPALAEALAAIRGESVIVAWVSSVTADKAGAVRKALIGSGLDPAGKDELVLLRFPEERKQTRRGDLAKELCVVAIAGDERADFDELFEYLKDAAVARELEPLVGNGWFLIPQPLTQN